MANSDEAQRDEQSAERIAWLIGSGVSIPLGLPSVGDISQIVFTEHQLFVPTV